MHVTKGFDGDDHEIIEGANDTLCPAVTSALLRASGCIMLSRSARLWNDRSLARSGRSEKPRRCTLRSGKVRRQSLRHWQ